MSANPRALIILRSSETAIELSELLKENHWDYEFHNSWQSCQDLIDDWEPDVIVFDGRVFPDSATLPELKKFREQHITTGVYFSTVWMEERSHLSTRMKLVEADSFVCLESLQDLLISHLNLALRLKKLEAQVRIMSQKLSLSQENLQNLTSLDHLTLLLNLPALTEGLQEKLRRCQRFVEPLSVLIISIDHFNEFSHRFGPMMGVHVLQVLSKELQTCFREDDQLGRSWGGRFIAVLPETKMYDATNIAERVRRKIERTIIRHGSHEIQVTITQGLSSYEPLKDHEVSAENLLLRAEKRLDASRMKGDGGILGELPEASKAKQDDAV